MSAPAALRPVPVAPSPRKIIADARDEIKLATRSRNADRLREVRDGLARLTVHYLVNGGGPSHDVALVSVEAQDALQLIVAVESYPRSVGRKEWSHAKQPLPEDGS